MSSKQNPYKVIEYLKAHTDHWCPIVSSKEIKQLLIERMNNLGVSAFEVCIRADVSYATFKKYYLEIEEPTSRPSLRPEDLMKIGKLIGIKIRTTVVVGDIEKIDRNKLLNEKYIPRVQRKKNKKLD